ncbi:MAG: carbohydrate binding family 9 domain-containing protein [Gammaproteobacteria bacterium]|nr:carbohydrate binding family 9 domain-containing protein [Gammaproteobacteria bacterium]
MIESSSAIAGHVGRTPLLLLALFASIADAQPNTDRKSIAIERTATPPRIDGILDDDTWSSASVIRDLHQIVPVDRGEPSEASAFYLRYDDDYLYLGARLHDSAPQEIRARQMIQGQGAMFDDLLELILDPFDSQRSGYLFQINPNGVRHDGLFEDSARVNSDWDGIWLGEARIDAQGWTAEIAIPFKTLNFDPANPDWGFTIARGIARKKERVAWSSYSRAVNLGTTGLMTGLSGLQQGLGLDLVPSVSLIRARNHVADDNDLRLEPSLDVFYKFTPSLTGVLTLNTDFSATEVDDRQVNLTRYSLFFPEKRDFFLQDADIFSFGGLGGMNQNGLPFFSRRIGLDLAGQPVDLRAGAKLTGRIGRWNIGGLVVDQAASGSVDEKLLLVARAAANVFDESSVGAIVTYGDPRSNRDNMVGGVDFRYRNTQFTRTHSLSANLWYQQSDTEGTAGGQWAWGSHIGINSGEGPHGMLAHDRFGRNFNPALGFANRVDTERTQVLLGYRLRPEHPVLRTMHAMLHFDQYVRGDGGVESQALMFRPIELENHRGDLIGLYLFRGREVLLEPFAISRGVIIQTGDYTFDRLGVELRLAPERTLAPRLMVWTGKYYGGTRFAFEGGVDWRPGRHLFLSMNYDYNDIELPEGNFETKLIQLRANWAFNARWSWVNLLQYDNISRSVGMNSRLRYNRRAGEDLFLVANYNFRAQGAFRGMEPVTSELLLKYSRTFRF